MASMEIREMGKMTLIPGEKRLDKWDLAAGVIEAHQGRRVPFAYQTDPVTAGLLHIPVRGTIEVQVITLGSEDGSGESFCGVGIALFRDEGLRLNFCFHTDCQGGAAEIWTGGLMHVLINKEIGPDSASPE